MKLLFSNSQLKFITDVLLVIGEVCLASLVIPYLTASPLEPAIFLWGGIAMVEAWLFGFFISNNLN